MGWFDVWLEEWRETYDEYPVATAITWAELLGAVGLLALSVVYIGMAPDAPVWAGLALLGAGTAFAVWFTAVRRPVMDRLVAE